MVGCGRILVNAKNLMQVTHVGSCDLGSPIYVIEKWRPVEGPDIFSMWLRQFLRCPSGIAWCEVGYFCETICNNLSRHFLYLLDSSLRREYLRLYRQSTLPVIFHPLLSVVQVCTHIPVECFCMLLLFRCSLISVNRC